MELANLSVEELRQLQDRIEREIKLRRSRDKKSMLSKIKALAAENGYTLDELLDTGSGAAAPVTTRTVAPKYRNPADSSVTWTGRGKQPRWVVDALASGKSLTDLLI